MPAILPLGNDVVDLRWPANRASAANPRYRRRVLASQERQTLGADESKLAFWSFWTAKEAAYKALRRADPDLVFAHRGFVVMPDAGARFGGSTGMAAGAVEHAGSRLHVQWCWNRHWVHCVTTHPGRSMWHRVALLDSMRAEPGFEAQANASQLADDSIAVRILAQSLLAEQGAPCARIERPEVRGRPGPPVAFDSDGRRLERQLSLSHDGRYVAAAVS